MKKRILAAVVAAAAVMSLAGCGDKNTSSTDNSTPANNNSTGDSSTPAGDNSTTPVADLTDEDNTLSIAVWGDNGDINHLIDFFKQESGTSVEVKMVDCGQGGEAAREQYTKILAADSNVDADLIICDMDWVRNYVDDGGQYTIPLSDLGISASEYTDAFAYTIGVGTDSNGVFKGATFQATPGAFFYRADLADQYLKVKTPDEMQAKVKDWDAFRATAKELADASGNKCALQCTEGGLWQVFQCNRTKAWVVDGKLEMDNAEEFMDMIKEMYDAKAITDAPQWDGAWYSTVQDGSALGDFAPTWGLTGLKGSILGDMAIIDENGENPQVQLALCDGPQGWYWGGSFFCATNKCNTKKTAAEFIRFYTINKDSMKKYSETYHDYMNNKSAMSEIVSAGQKNPSLVNGQDHFAILNKTVGSINVDGKLTTYDSVIKGKFNDAAKKYMTGELDKEAAITEFKNEVRAAFPDLTVE